MVNIEQKSSSSLDLVTMMFKFATKLFFAIKSKYDENLKIFYVQFLAHTNNWA